MRITLNLASRPFVELRPLFVRLRILSALLVVLAVAFFFLLRGAEEKAGRAQIQVQHWTQATQQLQSEWQRDQAMMREPANAATLDRSRYLNAIFAAKSFSWTTAMMDLELVLPQGVEVINIDPQMTKDNLVMVRLRVSGPRDQAVRLVANLEKSPDFLNPRITGEATEVQGQNQAGFKPSMATNADVNFDILAEFNAGNLRSADIQEEQRKSGAAEQQPRASGPAPAKTARPKAAGSRGVR